MKRIHLTVGERAILSLFLVAFGTGITAGMAQLILPGIINWSVVICIVIGTTIVAFGHTLMTYLSTNGDLPLGTIPIEVGVVEPPIKPIVPPSQS